MADEPNLQGIGLTMEGINQNSLMYDFVLDLAYKEFSSESKDPFE